MKSWEKRMFVLDSPRPPQSIQHPVYIETRTNSTVVFIDRPYWTADIVIQRMGIADTKMKNLAVLICAKRTVTRFQSLLLLLSPVQT